MHVGEPGAAVRLLFSRPERPYGDDPTLDFLVRARGEHLSVETLVRTWDGDGLDGFLASLAEDFRGWEGARTWRSLEHDLSLSAEHRSGGHVHLTWGLHDRPVSDAWRFEATTVHAAGEDMRALADALGTFLTGYSQGTSGAL
nr:DUF6228 family protein [Streptomyces sp. C]